MSGSGMGPSLFLMKVRWQLDKSSLLSLLEHLAQGPPLAASLWTRQHREGGAKNIMGLGTKTPISPIYRFWSCFGPPSASLLICLTQQLKRGVCQSLVSQKPLIWIYKTYEHIPLHFCLFFLFGKAIEYLYGGEKTILEKFSGLLCWIFK